MSASRGRSSVKAYRGKARYSTKKQAKRNPKVEAARAAANARVGGLMAMEHKFLDSALSKAIPSPTDGTGGEMDPASPALCLNAVPQGAGASTRDGKQCMIDNVFVNGTIDCAAVAGAATPARS